MSARGQFGLGFLAIFDANPLLQPGGQPWSTDRSDRLPTGQRPPIKMTEPNHGELARTGWNWANAVHRRVDIRAESL